MSKIYKYIKNIIFVILVITSCWGIQYPDYVLGPGDVVRIEIFDSYGSEIIDLYKKHIIGYRPNEVGLAFDVNRFVISYAGMIDIPSIDGRFYAKGKTIKQLSDEISEYAKIYDDNPKTVIHILNVKDINVYVMGAVGNPGLYKIPEDGYSNNLASLIAKAGGYSRDSNRSHIIIEKNGQKEEIALDDQERSKYTVENDAYIYVPDKKEFVFIFGEINNVALKGVKVFDRSLQLADYIAYAGGFTHRASKFVYIINDKQDKDNNTRVKMTEFLGIKEATGKIEIKPGTIIYAPKSFIAKWRDVFSDLILLRETIKYPQTFDDATSYYLQAN